MVQNPSGSQKIKEKKEIPENQIFSGISFLIGGRKITGTETQKGERSKTMIENEGLRAIYTATK